jgi:hypothetical protein
MAQVVAYTSAHCLPNQFRRSVGRLACAIVNFARVSAPRTPMAALGVKCLRRLSLPTLREYAKWRSSIPS